MRKRKNNFLTFVFSMLPGAGHMYLGLMKAGLCYMSLFFGICFLGSWLNVGPSLFIAAIVWFYAFFDSLNIMSLEDEAFFALEDHFLWGMDGNLYQSIVKSNRHLKAGFGIGFIVLGLMILWENLFTTLEVLYPEGMSWVFYRIQHMLPQLLFSFFIIWVGIKLILGKKQELKNEIKFIESDKEEADGE